MQRDRPETRRAQPLAAERDGFTLHATTRVAPDASDGLERLCRHLLRPPVADDRLTLLPDGRVALDLSRPWRDSTTRLQFDPVDLVARLAALVPAPRRHLVRHHGVFAPAARVRGKVVTSARAGHDRAFALGHARPHRGRANVRRRLAWAALLQRVFAIYVLHCPCCRGRMRIIARVDQPETRRRILRHLGLPQRPPPLHPARPPPGAETDAGP